MAMFRAVMALTWRIQPPSPFTFGPVVTKLLVELVDHEYHPADDTDVEGYGEDVHLGGL